MFTMYINWHHKHEPKFFPSEPIRNEIHFCTQNLGSLNLVMSFGLLMGGFKQGCLQSKFGGAFWVVDGGFRQGCLQSKFFVHRLMWHVLGVIIV
jgi:hypothetical protein